MSSTFILSVVVIFIALGVLIFLKQLASSKNNGPVSYRKLPNFLSPAERSFYGVLDLAVSENFLLFTKVRVADVISPAKGMNKSEWQSAFNKISAKHFDFVLCDKKDLSVLCVIELDDKSHAQKKVVARDKLLNSACKTADLPLIRFKAQSSYQRSVIEESLSTLLPKSGPTNSGDQETKSLKNETSINEPALKAKEIQEELCPKCNSVLVLRMITTGKNVGKQFMGCSTFPQCRYVQKQVAI